MSGTPYTCIRCGERRFSSNSRADAVGTVCPICFLAEEDAAAGRPPLVEHRSPLPKTRQRRGPIRSGRRVS